MKNDYAKAIPYYGVAVTWITYAMVFDLYAIHHFFGAAILSVLVFSFLRLICVRKKNDGALMPIRINATSAANEELAEVARDGEQALVEMHRLKEIYRRRSRSENIELATDIERIELTTVQIFKYIQEHPEKIGQIRKFMSYYLPTTLKLLNAYNQMDTIGGSGQNINTTKRRIAVMMKMIVAAFDEQLDKLFTSDAIDIMTDIRVLETMLLREGLINKAELGTVESIDELFITLR